MITGGFGPAGAYLGLVTGLLYTALAIYAAQRVVRNRACLHVSQRNPAVILSESLSLVMMTVAISVRWFFLLLGYTGAYEGFYRFSEFATGFILFIVPGGAVLRGYIIVLKFTDTGRVSESSWITKVFRQLVADCRTTRGQHTVLLCSYACGILAGSFLAAYGRQLCFRICRMPLPIAGSALFLYVPLLALVVVPNVWCITSSCASGQWTRSSGLCGSSAT